MKVPRSEEDEGLAKLYPGVFSSCVVTRAMAKKMVDNTCNGDVRDHTLVDLSETFLCEPDCLFCLLLRVSMLMINDIFSKIPACFGKSLFADDGAIWTRGRSFKMLFCQTQKALDQVVEWAIDWGFKISAAKGKFIIFGNKRKIPEVNLIMYNCPIERVIYISWCVDG